MLQMCTIALGINLLLLDDALMVHDFCLLDNNTGSILVSYDRLMPLRAGGGLVDAAMHCCYTQKGLVY